MIVIPIAKLGPGSAVTVLVKDSFTKFGWRTAAYDNSIPRIAGQASAKISNLVFGFHEQINDRNIPEVKPGQFLCLGKGVGNSIALSADFLGSEQLFATRRERKKNAPDNNAKSYLHYNLSVLHPERAENVSHFSRCRLVYVLRERVLPAQKSPQIRIP